MNIIIFGGNGFIGRVLQEKVKNHGHEFSVLDLPEEDILKPETFADKVKSFSARAIINMAGGLGGVVLPIMFGALMDYTGIRSSAFMLMYGVVWVSLIWMYWTEVRRSHLMGNDATPLTPQH